MSTPRFGDEAERPVPAPEVEPVTAISPAEFCQLARSFGPLPLDHPTIVKLYDAGFRHHIVATYPTPPGGFPATGEELKQAATFMVKKK